MLGMPRRKSASSLLRFIFDFFLRSWVANPVLVLQQSAHGGDIRHDSNILLAIHFPETSSDKVPLRCARGFADSILDNQIRRCLKMRGRGGGSQNGG